MSTNATAIKNLVMKKLYLLLSALIFLSCTKNNPKPGDYTGMFWGTFEKNGQTMDIVRSDLFKIVESNKTEIKISTGQTGYISSVLNKNKYTISGALVSPTDGSATGPFFPLDTIQIDGTWDKKDGKFIIQGTHSYSIKEYDVQNQTVNYYVVNGTFEIRSN